MSDAGFNDPDENDLDVLAGEYVLGVLDLDERRAVAARRLDEPQLDAAILRWENRLAPLLAYIAAEPPPPELWARIERELARPPVTSDLVAFCKSGRGAGKSRRSPLARSPRRWRWASTFGDGPSRHAAEFRRRAAKGRRLAGLCRFGRSFDARIDDPAAGCGGAAGKSYELWIINEKLGPPKSLGVVEKADFTSNDKLRAYSPEVVKSSLYAITVEQAGGSPDGKPSGPPVFAGKLDSGPSLKPGLRAVYLLSQTLAGPEKGPSV